MKTKIGIILFFFFATTVSFGQTISKNKLDNLLKRAEETHSEAVIVYKDNKLISEKYFGIGNPDSLIESMSCTKSIVGLTVACMLNDGLLDSLDVPVCKFYPEWRQGQKQNITIRHLVNMTSGLQNNPNATVEIYPSPNFVQLALAAELSNPPGETWKYNNKALNLMAGVIQKITNQRMDIYIGERLFKPLDIIDFNWTLDSTDNPHVMSGCQIRPIDFSKIGLLLLNKGKFKDKLVIAEKYINEVVSPCKQYDGYGMLWWIDYEQTISTIDNEIIHELINSGLSNDFIEKVRKVKGTYNSNDDYYAKIMTVFGDNPWQYINETLAIKNLRMRKKVFTGNVTYRADGYLGNFIIVDPKTKIVAIRMISYKSYQNNKDGFEDFGKLVLSLTK